MPHLFQTALLFVFPALVIVAAMRDALSFTIPNWVSIALVALFFPAALLLGAPLSQIGVCAVIGFCALIAGMGMFAAGWIGGGDAKLLAASALWMGWSAVAPFLLMTGLAGGALALLLLAMRSVWLRRYVAAGPGWMGRLATPGEGAPYGIAIAIGALSAFPQSLLPTLAGALS